MDLNSERGYALLTVLLTSTIFIMLGLTFIGQSLNSAKQNKQIEQKAQSFSKAEMGINYVEHAIRNIYEKEIIELRKKRAIEKKTNEFYSSVTKGILINALLNLDYEVNNKNLLFNIESYSLSSDENVIIIDYTSNGDKNTPINATLRINYKKWLNDVQDNVNTITVNGSKREEFYDSSVIFNNEVSVGNGKPLEITGNATFNYGITLTGNSGNSENLPDLKVYGDSYFKEIITHGQDGKNNKDTKMKVYICGNIYLWNGIKYDLYTNVEPDLMDRVENTCSNPVKDITDPISVEVTY